MVFVFNFFSDFGLLTFSFELRFTADGSEVDPDDTIDLTTGILGRLTVVGPDSLALDVHYDAVTAVADNGESATLIIEG